MNEPIVCDGCDATIELQDAYNCTVCRHPTILRCWECHSEHGEFEHEEPVRAD